VPTPRKLVRLHESDEDRQNAYRRLVGHYRQTSYAADRLLGPIIAARPSDPAEDVTTARLKTTADAVAWFNAERPVLKAVVQREIDEGRPGTAWRLVLSIQRFFHREGLWHDWAALAGTCLRAATDAGANLGRAHMLRSLSGSQMELGDLAAATRHYRQSLELFDPLGLPREQALVYRNLGQVSALRGDFADGVGQFESSLRLVESLGELSDQVNVLCCLADAQGRRNNFAVGTDLAARALSIAEALGDLSLQALCHSTLAEIRQLAGDLHASLAPRRKATELFRQSGWRVNAAKTQRYLGEAALALGDLATARAAWEEALDLFGHLNVPPVVEVRENLARLDEKIAGRPSDGR